MRQFLLLATLCCTLTAPAQQTITVRVKNPSMTTRTDQPVVISLQPYGMVASALVTAEGKEIPCQMDDLDFDEQMDELCFLSDLNAKEEKTYKIELYDTGEPREYPARVYAEMVMGNKNVKEKNKQDNYIEAITARGDCAYSYNLQHHHGVAFESELNGIRIYFDKRQTLDLYGKYSQRLELQQTQFYTSKEQKEQGYGDDVLWVGQTFGLGALRGWDGQSPTMIDPVRSRTQRIISYGPLRTIVEMEDRGWQSDTNKAPINLLLRYTQYAGHRDTDVEALFSHDVADYRFSTGIINVKGSIEFSDQKGLRGCWGTDYPSTDTINWKRETVGLGILIPRSHIDRELPPTTDAKDGGNYPFVVKAVNNRISYKVAYTSANESFGYHSANEWFEWLKGWKKRIEQPITIKLSAKR